MPEMENVIKEYEDYVNSYISLTTSHDYEFEMHKAVLALLKEQEATINELQNAYSYLQKQFFEAQDKLLKEQEAVVRCRDCKHRGKIGKCVVASIAAEKDYKYPIWMLDNRGEWFCADGEREGR